MSMELFSNDEPVEIAFEDLPSDLQIRMQEKNVDLNIYGTLTSLDSLAEDLLVAFPEITSVTMYTEFTKLDPLSGKPNVQTKVYTFHR